MATQTKKFQLPPDVTSFDFEGDAYTPGKDGFVDIPLKAIPAAKRHGLKDENEVAAAGEALSREDQLAAENAELKKRIAELEGRGKGKGKGKEE